MPDRFAVRSARDRAGESEPIRVPVVTNGIPVDDACAAAPTVERPRPAPTELSRSAPPTPFGLARTATGVGFRAGLSVGRAGKDAVSTGLRSGLGAGVAAADKVAKPIRAGLPTTDSINLGLRAGSGAAWASAKSGKNLVKRAIAVTASPLPGGGSSTSVEPNGVGPRDVSLDEARPQSTGANRALSTGDSTGGAPALARLPTRREPASPSEGGAKALSRARSRNSKAAAAGTNIWDLIPHVDAATAEDAETGQVGIQHSIPSYSWRGSAPPSCSMPSAPGGMEQDSLQAPLRTARSTLRSSLRLSTLPRRPGSVTTLRDARTASARPPNSPLSHRGPTGRHEQGRDGPAGRDAIQLELGRSQRARPLR